MNIDLSRLREPFPADDIDWRVQRSGIKDGKPWAMVLAYVENRAVMDRFDDVCGPANWRNEFVAGPAGGVLCGLGILIGDQWITKWDGADNTDIEQIKGGLSGAMKRAAVQWGVGRYLYNLETGFASVHDGGRYRGSAKKNPKDSSERPTWFKWDPPPLPDWALPSHGPVPPVRRALLDRSKAAADSGLLTKGELEMYRKEIRDSKDSEALGLIIADMEKAVEAARKRKAEQEKLADKEPVEDAQVGAEPAIDEESAKAADAGFNDEKNLEIF